MSRGTGTAVLGLLTVLLMLAVGLELRPVTREDTVMRDIPPPAGLQRPVAAQAIVAVDRRAAWVQTILARPLFAPDRRPVAAEAVAAGQASAALPRIAGILVDGARRSVIFAATNGGRPIIATEGTDVNGFKVQTIEANQVTIIGPDGARVLRPSFDANRIVPDAPPPALPGLPSLRLNPAGLSGIPGLPSAPAR